MCECESQINFKINQSLKIILYIRLQRGVHPQNIYNQLEKSILPKCVK